MLCQNFGTWKSRASDGDFLGTELEKGRKFVKEEQAIWFVEWIPVEALVILSRKKQTELDGNSTSWDEFFYHLI